MAEYNWLESLTFEAAADLSACQYHIVRISAAHAINLASNPTASSAFGVLQTKPKSGEFGTVGWLGKTKVVAGAAIDAGALIAVNGSGRAEAISVASGIDGWVIGRALEAAGADGEVITAMVGRPYGRVLGPES